MCCHLRRTWVLTSQIASAAAGIGTIALASVVFSEVQDALRMPGLIIITVAGSIASLLALVFNGMAMMNLWPWFVLQEGSMIGSIRASVIQSLTGALWSSALVFLDIPIKFTMICNGWTTLLIGLSITGMCLRTDDAYIGCCGARPKRRGVKKQRQQQRDVTEAVHLTPEDAVTPAPHEFGLVAADDDDDEPAKPAEAEAASV
jgi:hypothetical protein